MIEQQGMVVATDGGRAVVRLGGRVGCPACDAGQGCGAGVFGRLLRRRAVTLECPNAVAAQQGQAVVIGLPEALFLRLAARFYLYPLLAGLGGAFVGHYLSGTLMLSAPTIDATALLAAVLCAGAVLHRNRRWAGRFNDPVGVQLLGVVADDELERKEVVS
jgi:sigma-E factor negative regulatory protein RseC